MEAKAKEQKINFKKIALYILIAIIIIITVAVFSLKIYFNSQRLQKLVLPRLEKTIGRDISIENINLKFWPQLGVSIAEMKVANPDGFSEEHLAQLDSFILSVELLPLLQKEVQIKEVTINNLELDLIKKKDGSTNYQLQSTKEQSNTDKEKDKPDTSNQPSNFILDLDDLTLKNGRVSYNDLSKKGNIKMNGINSNNKLNIVGKNKKITTEGKLEIEAIELPDKELLDLKQENLSLTVDHQLSFNGQENILTADKFDVVINEFDLDNKFKVKFSEKGFQFEELITKSGDSSLDIKVLTKSGSKLYFALHSTMNLTELWEEKPIESDYSVQGKLNSDLTGQFDIKQVPKNLSSLELLGKIKCADFSFAGESLSDKITDTRTEISVDSKKIKVNSLQTKFLDSNFSGSADIEAWRDFVEAIINEEQKIPGAINFALESDRINLNQWQKNFAAQSTSEEENEQKNLAETTPDWPVRGKLKVGELKYQNIAVTDFETEIKSANDLIELLNLKFNLAGGEINGAGNLNLREDTPSYNGNLNISKMEVNQLLSTLTKFQDKLYGGINLDLDFSGTGLGVEDILNSLTMQGDVLLDNTKLSARKMIEQLNSYFQIIDKSELKLGKLKGRVKLDDGKLKVNKVKTVTNGDQITLDGYSTIDGKLNFKVDYLLSVERSKKMDLKHKELLYAPDTKRVQVALDLTGTTTKPKIKWDKSKLEQRIKEEAKEKVKEEAKEEKKKAEDKAKQKIEEKKEELKDKFKSLF
ncbi:AsmA family protein [Halanaerobacter jeridensis]|uniref:Uncharacterized protein involved in outer membrane biogenesis n=1 Tax=Halanaerobacter jeridensis TaxID=706427 RepID=A0A938XWA1_9FIRM|nr:AsmA family protein [Halanaerobacter jeridensis]MBM7556440.1 uncharacterized protein involved in outer membrane biogenesis [Halanaerobacter jeridensis]